MKKFQLLFLLFICAGTYSHAQYDYDFFAVGATASLPIGNPADIADFGLGLEGVYLRDIAGPLTIGGGIGYERFFSDNISGLEPDDIEFGFLVAKGLYRIGEQGFGLGIDLGYSVGLSDTADDGFTYEPKGYLNLRKFLITFGYKGVSAGDVTYDSVNLGVKYKL
jgi:hypothetical protein